MLENRFDSCEYMEKQRFFYSDPPTVFNSQVYIFMVK